MSFIWGQRENKIFTASQKEDNINIIKIRSLV